jgi:DNA-binding transcriptional regulator YdaS (Cro superfamily)
MAIPTKSQAVKLFGSQAAVARALGVSNQAISQWPEQLTQAQQDRLVGAAVRLGKLSARPQQAA